VLERVIRRRREERRSRSCAFELPPCHRNRTHDFARLKWLLENVITTKVQNLGPKMIVSQP
jgi:hypothetical protein